MPSTKLTRGLYWSEQTQTFHFLIKIHGKKAGGDTGCPTWPMAETWLLQHKLGRRQQAAGGHPEAQAPAPTLLQALAAWRKVHEGVSGPGHVANVARAVRLHAEALHAVPVDRIGTAELETLRAAYMRGRGTGHGGAQLPHSEGGANRVVHHVRLVLTWALGRKAPGPRPIKGQEGVRGILWPEQVVPFLEEAWRGGPDHSAQGPRLVPHSATALCLMIALGLREAEALGARWEWWDLRRQVYRVGRSKSRRVREVPVPAWLAKHLAALRKTQGNPARGLILPAALDQQGHQVPHQRLFTTKPVARCAAKLKLTGLTPHRLRATFATAHFESGTPLSQIQQMLGHRDPSTTMRYIVQRPKDQAKAQERVAKAMGFQSGPPSVPQKTKPKRLNPIKKRKTA